MVKIYNGVIIYQNEGDVVVPDYEADDFKINNIATINTARITSGSISSTPSNNTDIVNKEYVDGLSNDGVGKKEYIDGNLKGEIFNIYTGDNKNIASGSRSHAEGCKTTASGFYSHAEVYKTTASGDYSHAEGYQTKASGGSSHAEGSNTTASNNNSHAEGNNTTASGYNSHAEGYQTTASSQSSHAEGYQTTASGLYSHAGGSHTVANKQSMTAIGKYNINDSSLNTGKLFVVGNGTADNARSDAFVVKDDGSAYIQTKLNVNNQDIIIKDSNDNTKTNIDNINNINSSSISSTTGTISSIILTTGTISSEPTNTTDIANKSYVDSKAAGAEFDPSSTLTLTNSSSLITRGDITADTLIKTEKINNDMSYNDLYEIDTSYTHLMKPAGLFYCPYNNCIYTTKTIYNETSYIVCYNLTTNTASQIEIKSSNDSKIPFITSLSGFYDNSMNTPPHLVLTGYTASYSIYKIYYNILSSQLYIYTHPMKNAKAKISYNGYKYFYSSNPREDYYYNLIINKESYIDGAEENYIIDDLRIPIDYLLPLDNLNNYVVFISDKTIYLYKFVQNSIHHFVQLDTYDATDDINEDNIIKLVYNDNKNGCYLLTNKQIFNIDITNEEINFYSIFEISRLNNLTNLIMNYDKTFYLFCDNNEDETNIYQLVSYNSALSPNKELKITNSLSISGKIYYFYYSILKNNEMFCVYEDSLSETEPKNELCKVSLSNNSIISNCQTSLNGIIGINENNCVNIDTAPLNINDVITVGTLFNLLKNFTINNNKISMSYLMSNTFINSNKFINSC